MVELSITDITVDERCQPRVAVDPRVVDDYADEMVGGAEFPPLTVYHDGSTYWLADGFHRLSAAMKLGLADIQCDVRHGTMRDAILASCGANTAHGLRRTNADKRRAVKTLLRDSEWREWTTAELARRAVVSRDLIETVLQEDEETQPRPDVRKFVARTGVVTTLDTSKIRGGSKPRLAYVPEPIAEPEIEPDRSDWWDDNAETPPPPPPKQTHSATWIQPPVRTWEQDDAKAFAALLALQDASSRDARFVAAAAVSTNPVGARLMMQRSDELILWHRDFLAALKDQLT